MKALANSSFFEFEVIYFYASRKIKPYLKGFSYKILYSWVLFKPKGYLSPSLPFALKRHKYDIVILNTYTIPSTQLAAYWSTIMGIPWIFWGERPGMRDTNWRKILRKLLIFPICHYAKAILATGYIAVEDYQRLCQKKVKVFNFPYFINIDKYLALPEKSKVPIVIKFLYSGQLIYRKGVDILIKAFNKIAIEFPNRVHLTILGDGKMKSLLKAQVKPNTKDYINFVGKVEWSNIISYYAQADIFVLPSRHDGWGLVVNEAIATGMPVIASDKVGAVPDLIRNKETGLVIKTNSVESLYWAMKYFIIKPDEINRMGKNAKRLAKSFTHKEGVKLLYRYLKEVVNEQD